MPYFDYLGQAMAESASPTSSVYGTSAGNETLTAPAGPSSVDSGGGPGDLLIGSNGDNIFYVKDPSDIVQVADGLTGVKTVVAYTSFTLPANVQNLTSSGAFNYAAGNSLDNLIIVGNDAETLYGGGGNDVLVGGAGADTFIVKAGEGNDVIYGWNSVDQIQLAGTAFKSFADVQTAMTQKGSDVVLQLDPTETLTFRNVTAASFHAQQVLLPLDRSKLGALTFDDEFNSLQLYNFSSGTGKWQASFGFDPHNPNNYSLLANGEQERYTSADFQGTADHPLGLNPFSVSNGVLTITAQAIPANLQAYAYGGQYSSGLLDTRGIFEQKYGYFEVRMAIPTIATGAWPAFWLSPDPNPTGIEADVTENIAIQPNIDFVRGYGGAGNAAAFSNVLKTGDITGFHTYGMMWTPQTVTFYYDDQAVYQAPTPTSWTNPMYLIANLAVGGFGGNPDPSRFPASMQIDYIHAYALADGSSVVQNTTPLAPGGTLHLIGGMTGGQPALSVQTFDDDHTAVTTRRVVQISTDPQHASQAELNAAGGKALLIWDSGGAVFASYKDGASYTSNTAVAIGTVESLQMTGGFLSDGKAVLTYVQNDGGVQDVWASVVNPVGMSLVKQLLGATSGGITEVATAHGGFAVSWRNGAETDARGYDGYGYFGAMVATPGDVAGVDTAGHLVVSWSDASGQYSQLYDVYSNPFALPPTATTLSNAYDLFMRHPPQSGDLTLVEQLGAQVDQGAISLDQAGLQLAHQSALATASVATLSYEFFTGLAPTLPGMDYLISPSGPNPNNLNSAYYQTFNVENRYINFAVNLGKLGEGALAFAQSFGGLDLFDATRAAYSAIFGGTPSDAKLQELLDPVITFSGETMTRADYFALYGQDGPDGIGTKAAMVGWLLAEADKADLGTYALSNDAYLVDIGLHGAAFGVNIIGHYAQPSFAYQPG